jgi:hypothetical protein
MLIFIFILQGFVGNEYIGTSGGEYTENQTKNLEKSFEDVTTLELPTNHFVIYTTTKYVGTLRTSCISTNICVNYIVIVPQIISFKY